MPELPEVETIVRDLRPSLIGKTIEGVALSWPGAVAGMQPEEFVRRVAGRRIEGIDRRGKNILIRLSGGEVLLIHLRMSGRLTVVPVGAEEQRFQRAALRLDSGEELRLADLRKFGRLQLLPAAEAAQLDARLGPEPLGAELTPEAFQRLLGGRRARLKALLLDQSFLAGIGNIYADEALFTAGLHPHRLAAGLSEDEARRLYAAVQDVLRQSIANRGTTFSDYRDGRGQPGGHQHQLKVYRRTGEPCYRCGTPIERLRFGGRGTHYCPRCQPIYETIVATGSGDSADARRQFGRQAQHYAVSASHSRGASLEMLASWANPRAGDLVLDVATGTGFAAFALAIGARLVIATDITGEMLAEARRLARERDLRNVRFAYSAAEHLAFADGSFDLVTCRIAAHHFADVPRFVAEVHRVCKSGGRALLVDTTTPENEPLAALMNDLERRRDPSHVRNYSPSQWRALFERQGFVVRRTAVVKTDLEFEDWVRRSGTPAGEVAILRWQFETAAPEAVAAFAIRREAGELRFAWDAVVLEGQKSGEA